MEDAKLLAPGTPSKTDYSTVLKAIHDPDASPVFRPIVVTMIQKKVDSTPFPSMCTGDSDFSEFEDDQVRNSIMSNVSTNGRNLSISSSGEAMITGTTLAARRRRKLIRVVVTLSLAAFIIYVIIDAFTTKYLEKVLIEVLEWMAKHPLMGFGVAVALIAVGAVLCLPHVILAIGYGYIFGAAFGMVKGVTIATLSIFLGSSIGALLAFILGRYLFREFAGSMMEKYPTFRAVDKAMEGNGFKIMLLLRLSPMPFNILDYMAGMTSVPIGDYALALIALIPNSAVLAFVGASAKSLEAGMKNGESGKDKVMTVIMVTCAVVFTLSSLGITSYYAKIELDKTLKNNEEDLKQLSEIVIGD